MIVYVLTGGSYSGMSVLGVYSDKQQADHAASLIEDGYVQEFELDVLRPVDPGMDQFCIEMGRDGKVIQHRQRSRLDSTGDRRIDYCSLRTRQDYNFVPRHYWRLSWDGYASDLQHAVKIVNEIRMQLLAGQCPPGVDMGKNAPVAQTEGKT